MSQTLETFADEQMRKRRQLPDLSSDMLELVMRRLAPRAVGRLLRSCKAVSAVRHPDWPWLHATVTDVGWENAGEEAASCGRLQALQWAHAAGRALTGMISSAASEACHLDVLIWATAQTPPCPLFQRACEAAARGGHGDVLCFLRAQTPPCPWRPKKVLRAAWWAATWVCLSFAARKCRLAFSMRGFASKPRRTAILRLCGGCALRRHPAHGRRGFACLLRGADGSRGCSGCARGPTSRGTRLRLCVRVLRLTAILRSCNFFAG